MGAWGCGAKDNDHALDYLGRVSDATVAIFRQTMIDFDSDPAGHDAEIRAAAAYVTAFPGAIGYAEIEGVDTLLAVSEGLLERLLMLRDDVDWVGAWFMPTDGEAKGIREELASEIAGLTDLIARTRLEAATHA